MRYHLALPLLLALALCGCGRTERVAQSFVEIDQAAQAQLQGVAVEQTATAIRAHALVGLKTLGYDLSEEEQRWLTDQFPK